MDDLFKIIRQMLEKIISWPLNGGKKQINNIFVTGKRCPRPLNRGIKFSS